MTGIDKTGCFHWTAFDSWLYFDQRGRFIATSPQAFSRRLCVRRCPARPSQSQCTPGRISCQIMAMQTASQDRWPPLRAQPRPHSRAPRPGQPSLAVGGILSFPRHISVAHRRQWSARTGFPITRWSPPDGFILEICRIQIAPRRAQAPPDPSRRRPTPHRE